MFLGYHSLVLFWGQHRGKTRALKQKQSELVVSCFCLSEKKKKHQLFHFPVPVGLGYTRRRNSVHSAHKELLLIIFFSFSNHSLVLSGWAFLSKRLHFYCTPASIIYNLTFHFSLTTEEKTQRDEIETESKGFMMNLFHKHGEYIYLLCKIHLQHLFHFKHLWRSAVLCCERHIKKIIS